MEAAPRFDRLRAHSIGLPQVLFQSTITYANRIALGWIGDGIVLTVWLSLTRPERLRDMDRVYVEDESISPQDAAAQFPVA